MEGTAQLNKAEPPSTDSTPDPQEECDHHVPARVVTLIPPAGPPAASGQQSFQPTADEISAHPEAPKVTNIMSGPRFPLGQVLIWMGCLVWNYDILLDDSHDITRPGARESIAAQAKDSDLTTSGPACGTYTRAREIRRDDLPGGGPPQLRSTEHPLGLPAILEKPAGDRDRSSVENANEITLWLFNLLFDLVAMELAVLAENPRNSIMWLTPEANA